MELKCRISITVIMPVFQTGYEGSIPLSCSILRCGLERLQLGLISRITRVRIPPPQLIKSISMGESTTKDGKVITAIYAPTVRAIVNAAREFSIQRDDIVSLEREGNQYILIYYEDGKVE